MGARVFMLQDGTKATVPDEVLDKWMQRMDTRGVKFRDADMSGEMTVGEPQVIKSTDRPEEIPQLEQPGAAPEPPRRDEVQVTPKPEEQPFSWRGLYDKLTSGGADAGTLSRLREAQPVNGTEGMVKNVAGLLVPPVMRGAEGAGLLYRAAAPVVNQAVSGAASGALDAALDDKDLTASTVGGAAGGAALGGAGALAGAVVGGAGRLAGGVADRARIAAAGLDANTRKELAKKFGVADLPASLAAMIERVSPSPRLGQSALTRAEGLAQRLEEVGPKIDETLRTAGEGQGLNAFVPDAWADLQGKVAGRAGAQRAAAVVDAEDALAGALERQASRLGGQPAPSDLVGMRQANSRWGNAAYGDSMTIGDSASRHAAGELRDAGESALDGIMSHALPETEQAFHGFNRDYGEAALLERAARNRAAVDAGGTEAPAVIAGLVSGMANGGLGVQAAVGSGTRSMLQRSIGGARGLDVIANAARGAGKPLQAAGGAIRAGSNASGEIAGKLAAALAAQDLTDEERRQLEEEALR